MIGEFKSILDLLAAFPDEQACIDHLAKIRWEGKPVSPFDASSKVYKCAGNRYRCRNTGKYFSVRVGTIFENSNVPLLKWFMALYIFQSHKKGISSCQLAKDIHVTQKTAWFMLHRLRKAFNVPEYNKVLEGQIELDETYIGGKEKNKHFAKKAKGPMAGGGRSTISKTAVFGMMQRGGHVIATVVDNVQRRSLHPIIKETVMPGSVLHTDEWKGYKGINAYYEHHVTRHKRKEYAKEGSTTNRIENFWSHLKRGLMGIYHRVDRKHLQAYVTEFTMRYNSREMSTHERFHLVLRNIGGKLPYKKLVGVTA